MWTDQSQISAAEPPAVITNEIPEHDTSIDTGSLTSEEKNKLFPGKPHFPLGKSALFTFLQLYELRSAFHF